MKVITKRDLIAATVGAGSAALAAGLIGCGANTAFVASADTFANTTVGPEYQAYVQADPTLNPEQKTDRLQNLDSFRRAVEEAKGGAGR
jgi:hypothetical protein